eukprot:7076869-Alexandrium_andersonii.AAC.1
MCEASRLVFFSAGRTWSCDVRCFARSDVAAKRQRLKAPGHRPRLCFLFYVVLEAVLHAHSCAMPRSNGGADVLLSPRRRVAHAKTTTRADATARLRARER